MDERIGRRSLLRHAGVAAGAGVVATLVTGGEARASGEVSGSWLIDRQNDGDAAPTRGIFSFAAGGVLIYQDLFSAGPVAQGTWDQGDRGTVRATFWGAYPAKTADDADITARVRMTCTARSGALTGDYEAVFFYQATDYEVARAKGSFRGWRVRV